MNRTARGAVLFTDDAVCALFLDTVAEVPLRFGARVHGYALMPNHYHLMLEVPRGNLSQTMRHVGGVFAQRYHRLRPGEGQVFRGRFHNELVQDDEHWLHLLAYLHLNPVRAFLAPEPRACPWTSHLAYVDSTLRPDWLTCDELLAQFGSVEALEQYLDDLQRKRLEPPPGFGGAPTVTEVRPPPAPPPLRTPEQALADVSAVTGVAEADLMQLPRGRTPNAASWLAIWWAVRATAETQADVARRWGVSRPRVSQVRHKLFALSERDPQTRAHMAALEEILAPTT